MMFKAILQKHLEAGWHEVDSLELLGPPGFSDSRSLAGAGREGPAV